MTEEDTIRALKSSVPTLIRDNILTSIDSICECGCDEIHSFSLTNIRTDCKDWLAFILKEGPKYTISGAPICTNFSTEGVILSFYDGDITGGDLPEDVDDWPTYIK